MRRVEVADANADEAGEELSVPAVEEPRILPPISAVAVIEENTEATSAKKRRERTMVVYCWLASFSRFCRLDLNLVLPI